MDMSDDFYNHELENGTNLTVTEFEAMMRMKGLAAGGQEPRNIRSRGNSQ